MPFVTIIGSVGPRGQPLREASVTSPKISVSCLDGGWMTIIHRPGIYDFTATAENYAAKTIRVKVPAIAIRKGKIIRVSVALRAESPDVRQQTAAPKTRLASAPAR
jgi:hypothetical protein